MASNKPPRLLVTIPMKPLADAKSRLASEVPPAIRAAATLMMLRRVIRAVEDSIGLKGKCVVVGGDTIVAGLVQSVGAVWTDEKGHDLNSSLWMAMEDGFFQGAIATMFLPADLPQIDSSDVTAIVEGSDGLKCPVIVAAGSDGGTNTILFPVESSFPPLLGGNSFATHCAFARERGTPFKVMEPPGLLFDVDSANDLKWAVDNLTGFAEELGLWLSWYKAQLMIDGTDLNTEWAWIKNRQR